MVELVVLTGPQSGSQLAVPRLPARVGRSREADVQLSGPGVWDRHFDLVATPEGRVAIRTLGEARVVIDSVSVAEQTLRNGELLEVGGIQVRFLMVESRQRPLTARETFVWSLAAIVVCLQGYLVWWTGR